MVFAPLMVNARLTGEWTTESDGCYKIRQIGNQIYWYLDDKPRVINVFTGNLSGSIITGTWADLPGGNLEGSGTQALRIDSPNKLVKIDQSANYLGSVWIRGGCQNTTTAQPTSSPDLSGTWYD